MTTTKLSGLNIQEMSRNEMTEFNGDWFIPAALFGYFGVLIGVNPFIKEDGIVEEEHCPAFINHREY